MGFKELSDSIEIKAQGDFNFTPRQSMPEFGPAMLGMQKAGMARMSPQAPSGRSSIPKTDMAGSSIGNTARNAIASKMKGFDENSIGETLNRAFDDNE